MAQRQQVGNGYGGIVTVIGGGGDGVNNAGGNAAGIGNGSTGGVGVGVGGGVRGVGVGVGGVSATYYQNAMQAGPGWAFQLLPSLYNHYQKVLRIHRFPSPSSNIKSPAVHILILSTRLASHHLFFFLSFASPSTVLRKCK